MLPTALQIEVGRLLIVSLVALQVPLQDTAAVSCLLAVRSSLRLAGCVQERHKVREAQEGQQVLPHGIALRGEQSKQHGRRRCEASTARPQATLVAPLPGAGSNTVSMQFRAGGL